MKRILEEYASYNLWANIKIAHFLKGLKEVVLDEEVGSSFNTIRKTVYHIWDAEYIWLERLQGNSINFWPSTKISSNEPIDSFLITSQNFERFVHSKSELFFVELLSYQTVKGEKYTQPNYQIIHHCFNHSNFHRGQIVTMIRELVRLQKINSTLDFPVTDLIMYYRQINFK
jgi:uncharacterized damage-inducible protein DinB